MEFLAFSVNPERKERTRLYGGLVLVSCWRGWARVVGLSLCYYEPLPYHVQATKRRKGLRCKFVSPSLACYHVSLLIVLVVLAIVDAPFF